MVAFCFVMGGMMFTHGEVRCERCWGGLDAQVQESGPFKLVRDPGHWGAENPRVLVLGISKGNTQSQAFGNSAFEDVAFKGLRDRMLMLFQAAGLLGDETPATFNRRFKLGERDFAFASVVRCSITGWNPLKGSHTAESPFVIPAFKAGSAGNRFVVNCTDQHLAVLPDRTKLVLLLGNTGAYIKAMASLLDRVRARAEPINPVAYRSGGVLFVHLAHPSKGNGHFGAYIRGDGTPGEKRNWAREAISAAGL